MGHPLVTSVHVRASITCGCFSLGSLLLRSLLLALRNLGFEHAGEPDDAVDPDGDGREEDSGNAACAVDDVAEDNHDRLLHERATRLADACSEHVDGGLALDLALSVEGNVGHLLRRVEQRVLDGLGEDVLPHADPHRLRQHALVLRRVSSEDEGEEGGGEGAHEDRRCERAHCPAQVLHNVGAEEDDDEGGGADQRRVVTHEDLVVLLVGVLLLDKALPDDLGEVDGEAVAHDEDAEEAEVLLLHEELEAVHHPHLGLLGLGLLRRHGAVLVLAAEFLILGVEHVDDLVEHQQAGARSSDEHGRVLERHAERVVAVVGHARKVCDRLAGANRSNVGELPEERVEALGLPDGDNVVGELPEEHTDAHGAPELGDDIEEGVAPVAEQRHGILPSLIEAGGHGRVDQFPVGVKNKSKEDIERQERAGRDVEEHLLREDGGDGRVVHHEGSCRREHTVHLEESDALGAAGRDHEGVLGVTDGGVDVDDEKHHERHTKELGHFPSGNREQSILQAGQPASTLQSESLRRLTSLFYADGPERG
mmetsp:Transcript_1427/g.2880  ORF Transcript_1427/g.2880 Transcript_1427/m.2880 type:complete len:538 (-) Transcript_1427:289-1902(-)